MCAYSVILAAAAAAAAAVCWWAPSENLNSITAQAADNNLLDSPMEPKYCDKFTIILLNIFPPFVDGGDVYDLDFSFSLY